ncbi:hypothetical protein K432DRAFT_114942 [Lepidopterella palustris CBS 459.81]|uniref:Uncharacterized protein n=1 Tax=Lepidopterella palustris CBS 459.81 TaxID=1314670 RepID=A0A8E2E5N3_9PEZI|nr:hypothetical protein K432DRAFT_114942 [Lepidopterella palustris CBS 459.81]
MQAQPTDSQGGYYSSFPVSMAGMLVSVALMLGNSSSNFQSRSIPRSSSHLWRISAGSRTSNIIPQLQKLRWCGPAREGRPCLPLTLGPYFQGRFGLQLTLAGRRISGYLIHSAYLVDAVDASITKFVT